MADVLSELLSGLPIAITSDNFKTHENLYDVLSQDPEDGASIKRYIIKLGYTPEISELLITNSDYRRLIIMQLHGSLDEWRANNPVITEEDPVEEEYRARKVSFVIQHYESLRITTRNITIHEPNVLTLRDILQHLTSNDAVSDLALSDTWHFGGNYGEKLRERTPSQFFGDDGESKYILYIGDTWDRAKLGELPVENMYTMRNRADVEKFNFRMDVADGLLQMRYEKLPQIQRRAMVWSAIAEFRVIMYSTKFVDLFKTKNMVSDYIQYRNDKFGLGTPAEIKRILSDFIKKCK